MLHYLAALFKAALLVTLPVTLAVYAFLWICEKREK